jgi:hypothetical protein
MKYEKIWQGDAAVSGYSYKAEQRGSLVRLSRSIYANKGFKVFATILAAEWDDILDANGEPNTFELKRMADAYNELHDWIDDLIEREDH